jgi:H+/Cl- antiporter ClcA
MILLKCTLAGLLFLVGYATLLFLGAIALFAIFFARHKGVTVGFDPVSIVKSSPMLWVLAILLFVLGFAWEHRRFTPH